MGRRKKPTTPRSLASLERDIREMLADSVDALRRQSGKVSSILDTALDQERPDGKMIRDMSVTQGILIDKTKDITRSLRDLEAATDEELEVVFDIYEEDPGTGERVLVSKVTA
jgi:hypothetical protein